jgi:hypothetical protein
VTDNLDVVRIPCEPGVLRTMNLPPETLQLPLVATRSWKLVVAAIVCTGFGALFLVGSGMALVGLALYEDRVLRGIAMGGLLVFGLIVGAWLSGAAFTANVDLEWPSPLLVLDRDGVHDRRLPRFTVAWRDVAHARIVYTRGGIGSVRLRLKQPARARFNPFRLGPLFIAGPDRTWERQVGVMTLNQRPHTLAFAIVALAKRHGATVETQSPSALGIAHNVLP